MNKHGDTVVNRIIIFTILLGMMHASLAGSGKAFGKQRVSAVERESHSGLNFKPILASLVMPGWGEYQLGHSRWAKGFVSEVMLWLSYAGIIQYSRVLEKDYQAYAALHAGANPDGKDDQYWIDIGNANNIYQFNERRRRKQIFITGNGIPKRVVSITGTCGIGNIGGNEPPFLCSVE